MNKRDAKTVLNALYEDLVDSPDGVGPADLADAFMSSNPDAAEELGASIFGDWLRKAANNVISAREQGSQGVLPIAGVGDFPATVTVRDGEGGFKHKTTRFASVADIESDVSIQEENADRILASLARSRRLHRLVIPVMKEHSLDYAEQAFVMLAEESA